MSVDENEHLNDTTTEVSDVEAPEAPEPKVEPRLAIETKGEKSIRHMLTKNIKEINKDPDEEVPLTAKERRAAGKTVPVPDKESAPVKGAAPSAEKTPEGEESEVTKTPDKVIPDKPQASGIAAPAALTKEEKAQWDAVPKEMQEAFLRRERDTQKGVEQLKAKYQPIEDVLAPVTPLLQQNGLTPAHAVKQLFDWHRALASPNKAAQINAFRALAQSHNVDLSSFNIQPVAHTPSDSQPQQVDPLQQIESLLEQRLQPVNQQLANYQAEIQRQKLDEANKELATFSADKPYMERPGVKPRMAEILQMSANFGRSLTLKEAYDQAIWSMDDLRTEMLQEQEAKREADFKTSQELAARKAQDDAVEKQRIDAEAKVEARRKETEALEKARRASVSPRGTSPVGAVNVPGAPKKGQAVVDTLRAAMKDIRSGV